MKPSPTLFAIIVFVCSQSLAAQQKPLRVFILAGQSNMEGHAQIRTFDYIGDDPATAPLLRQMRGADGKPAVCDGVWVSYLTSDGESDFELTGKLTAGYGSMWGQDRTRPGEKIGPEFTFGLTMDEALDEPVLIIKTAWGGKSLHTDFRAPSAGPYLFSASHLERLKERGEDIEAAKAAKIAETGHYYRLMIDHVRHVLGDIKRVYPDYDEQQGYEISGFVWLQGWNDLVDSWTYPDRGEAANYDAYSEVLAHFIRDVRKDINAPDMPFVIGVLGVDGANPSREITAFREAMAAPERLPEFQGNVTAVPTAPFWSEELGAIAKKHDQVRLMRHFLDSKHKDHPNADGSMTDEQKQAYQGEFEAKLISPDEKALWERGASNGGYHYLGCAKTFAQMGRAFAEVNLTLMKDAR